MEFLCLDIWMQILSGLGVTDLIRLKFVSKTLLDLISSLLSNHDFIRLHLSKSSLRAIHHDRHIYLRLKQHGEAESSLRAIQINGYTYCDFVKQTVREDEIAAVSYGSCNGLVCLLTSHNNNKKYAGGVWLWNPALREAACVPIKRPQEMIYNCWFGYDNDEYKLILGTASHIHLIRLYIDTDSWKSSLKIHTNYKYRETIGTLVHRVVHWPAYYREDDKHTIISYDLSNETVGTIATPDGVTMTYPFVLGQVDGCLSAMFGNNHLYCKVGLWVMKEYGVQESWTKFMVLPLNSYHIFRGEPHAVQLDDPAQLTSPIYGKDFYVESLISPRSIKTKM